MDRDPRDPPEDALRAAELLELGDALLELDRDWRIVRVNARQEELSRKPRRETVGRTFAAVWPELATPASRYWREYDRCMRERVPVQFDAYYAALDLWTDVTAYPVTSGGIAIFFRDVTAENRAAKALRESEERFRSVVEHMSEGLMLFDTERNLVYQNPASLRIHGFDPDKDGRLGREQVPVTWNAWDDQGRPITFDEWPVSRVFRGEHFQNQVLRVERVETGRIFFGSYNGSPIFGADGRLVLGFITIRDITERMHAERQYRSLAENAPEVIARFDRRLRHTFVNGYGARVYGVPAGEVIGKTSAELGMPPDKVALWERHFEEVFATGEQRTVDFDFDSPTFGRQHFSSLFVPERDETGAVASILAITRDVTPARRAEEALREADRRKDEFLGMLSHELRNPLAPIRNSLYILDRAEPNGHQARRAKEVANRQIAHLTRLVDDLLDVTRIARGKIELRRAKVDLGTLARRTAEDYRPVLQERGVDLVLAVPDEALAVDGDETRLAQVLGNLLSNAAKFTPAGGRVTLAVERSGDRAAARVRDTGVGIAPDLLAAIFDPFTQAKQTLARSEGGLGLGLALVKGLTELHGGRVSVTSAGAGTGTEFTVELPLVHAVEAAQPSHRAAGARRTYRVLVVDDNVDAAESLADLVRLFGHEVEVAYDGPTAVASALTRRPDVVLCDIGLPGMDGYEVAKVIRAKLDGQVRLVAVSGYAQPEDVKRAADAGFDQHIAKPPDPARIERLFP